MWKFIKNLFKFKIGRCCGDCKYFTECWGSYRDITYEAPSCKEFKERINYEQ